jgi:hypothetical protein
MRPECRRAETFRFDRGRQAGRGEQLREVDALDVEIEIDMGIASEISDVGPSNEIRSSSRKMDAFENHLAGIGPKDGGQAQIDVRRGARRVVSESRRAALCQAAQAGPVQSYFGQETKSVESFPLQSHIAVDDAGMKFKRLAETCRDELRSAQTERATAENG